MEVRKKTDEVMSIGEITSRFLTHVLNQGFSVVLLFAVVVYFQLQNQTLQTKVDLCTEAQLNYYKAQLSELQNVMQENTRALNRNTDVILSSKVKD